MDFIDARPAYEWLAAHEFHEDVTEAWEESPSSVVFVVGSGSETAILAAKDLYHYERDRNPLHDMRIAFISNGGGFGGNLLWGVPEVEHYAAVLRESGVPEKALLYPNDKSEWTTNTLVEAQGAVPFLTRRLGFRPEHIILCIRPVHQRRALLTFFKQHTNIRYLICCSADDEPLSTELLPRILGEIKRIREYGAKG